MNDRQRRKIVFLGDVQVGKTSVFNRMLTNNFNGNEATTIGAVNAVKEVYVENKLITMQLWDTAGHERYRSITSIYLRNADAAIFMYSISDKATFDSLREWLDMVASNLPEQAVKLLVGNKRDKSDSREVSFEDGSEFANKMNAKFIEVSAKSGEGIEDFIFLLAMELAKISFQPDKQPSNKLGNTTDDNKDKKSCCG